MRIIPILLLLLLLFGVSCSTGPNASPNPWLVPFQDRSTSAVSRSQMRAMARLANIYREAGLEAEYEGCISTAFDLYPGDLDNTYTYLNILIDRINVQREEVTRQRQALVSNGIDIDSLTRDSLPGNEPERSEAVAYLDAQDELQQKYDSCYRIMAIACDAVPYNADLYYTTANLQYMRAVETDDRDKYKDAIYYLKKAISTDSGHLESYSLIALCYEKLGDNDRAIRFWRLLETVYEIAPEVIEDFRTPEHEEMHRIALQHLANLGAGPGE
jgi:tetratricopeptide (TPR) repeat protein